MCSKFKKRLLFLVAAFLFGIYIYIIKHFFKKLYSKTGGKKPKSVFYRLFTLAL